MLSFNTIRMDCAQRVRVALTRSIYAYRNTSLICTCKRGLHTPPKITVDLHRTKPNSAATATTGKFKKRLKREDFSCIGYESAFSEWKILVESWDEKNDSLLKKQSNLQNFSSCAGAYELGIAACCRIDSRSVIPVYVGHTENMKSRLQRYRRNGAHLENGYLKEGFVTLNGARLFSKTLSKGFKIVYRVAPMKSKKDAENLELQLLKLYDYGWNERSNGERRPHDIAQKLETEIRFCFPRTLLQCFHLKKVVNKTENSLRISSRIFRILMFQNGRVDSVGFRDVEGRKQCVEHKGMEKIKYNREGKAHLRLNHRSVTCKACANFEHKSSENFSSNLWNCFKKWFSLR